MSLSPSFFAGFFPALLLTITTIAYSAEVDPRHEPPASPLPHPTVPEVMPPGVTPPAVQPIPNVILRRPDNGPTDDTRRDPPGNNGSTTRADLVPSAP